MKKLLSSLLVAGLAASCSFTALAADNTDASAAPAATLNTEIFSVATYQQLSGTWQQSGSRYWFKYTDDTYATNAIVPIDGINYGFDNDGWMITGWGQFDGVWYYFNADGAMQYGWQKIGGKWYYLDPDNGNMWGHGRNEEFSVDGEHYYFCADGSLANGWFYVDYIYEASFWIYCEEGKPYEGWHLINSSWYYFAEENSLGPMLYDNCIADINGVTYAFDAEGRMITGWGMVTVWYDIDDSANFWCYCDANGVVQHGWQYIDGYWYYFGEESASYGVMYANYVITIDGVNYAFAPNGVMVKNAWFLDPYENEWYYFDGSGAGHNGWLKDGANWYYCENGKMVYNDTITTDGDKLSKFDENGIWQGYVE